VTVTDLPPGRTARIWIPVPPSNAEQEVKVVTQQLPGEGKVGRDKTYGNDILYVEGKAGPDGKLPLKIIYRVTRKEVQGPSGTVEEPARLARFLQPDARVPISGKPLELLQGVNVPEEPLAAAKVLYDVVNRHLRYSKDVPGWGRGDSVWACESKSGNCTDFHSLFASLARSRRIPVQFEIGFPLPEMPGAGEVKGYHCWAKFYVAGEGWIPVDISEANKFPRLAEYYFGNLTADRVAFNVGRDLELTPRQDAGPLNYFVFPHVEVDGRPHPPEKQQRTFAFRDVS